MKAIYVFSTMLLLTACSPADEPPAPAPQAAAAPAVAAYSEFNTVPTIRDVMNALIDPSADALWNAVRFDVDETGEHAYRPETEEEWLALRYHAVSIIEGSNALMIPGRPVAPPGATTEFPEYEYLPEEVDAKLREDRQSWVGFAQALQESALVLLEAVEARDADLLLEHGAALDAACESCHMQYWYRPEP